MLDKSEVINRVTTKTRRHVLSALLEGAQLLAHLEAWNVIDNVEQSERGACEIGHLFGVPDLLRTLSLELRLVGFLVAEEEDQGVDGLG